MKAYCQGEGCAKLLIPRFLPADRWQRVAPLKAIKGL
jgi:hypothetical protein